MRWSKGLSELFRNIIISAVILLLSSISASAARVGEGDYVPEIGKGVRPAVQALIVSFFNDELFDKE